MADTLDITNARFHSDKMFFLLPEYKLGIICVKLLMLNTIYQWEKYNIWHNNWTITVPYISPVEPQYLNPGIMASKSNNEQWLGAM